MKYIIWGIFAFFLLLSPGAQAFSTIRDTEVENVLLGYIQKNFKAAGLNPQNAQVVVVNDDSINAFVAGGQTIFIHSGLITHAKSVDDVVFVLAHETGHIVGGHVTRGIQQLKAAQTTALISTVLGGLLAVASGRPDAGMAVMLGGNSSIMGSFMAYRQSEESAADRTAVDIMHKTGYSLMGFTHTMKEILAQERLNSNPDNMYLRTHPITQDRMRDMERFTQNAGPIKSDSQFDLIKAKLVGFLYSPAKTRMMYKSNTLADKYALAIADYRDNKIQTSLKKIDDLIKIEPDNPFFHELKGQFLFETGQIEPAVNAYKKAIGLLPKASLIRLSLGQALTESENPKAAQEAVTHLSRVVAEDPHIPIAWRLLAVSYGKSNNIPMADYAMAEYYQLMGDNIKASKMARRAVDKVPANTPAYQHLQDILSLNTPSKK